MARQVVIAGAGMVGLTLAIDLALQGVDVLVLEKSDGIGVGSRSICQAKRTLEIWDRLGVGEVIRDRGVTWRVGRLFHAAEEIFAFDLLSVPGHKMPAFVNLQQFHVEAALRARLRDLGGEVRLHHTVVGVTSHADGVVVQVETPEGAAEIDASWLVSCEGVRSTVRRALGLSFSGETFQDKFLIADVRFTKADHPPERWFWFAPPFHDGQTSLLHRQADDVWRIDLQLGPEADPETERHPDRVRPRIRQMLGHDDFELVWVSVYVFQCRTLDRYVHGRVVFAGDSAHQVSPFGARGGNGGVQDADNLGWKLARVVDGRAPAALVETYNTERLQAARENILNSTRATDFMSPKTPLSRVLRDETLALARVAPFARALVNSGRLSVPVLLTNSPLSMPDDAVWAEGPAPGSPAIDAPVIVRGRPEFLCALLEGGFTLLTAAGDVPTTLDVHGEMVRVLASGRDFTDAAGLVAARYDLQPGSMVLLRPDQHVAMRRRSFSRTAVAAAVARALALAPMEAAA